MYCWAPRKVPPGWQSPNIFGPWPRRGGRCSNYGMAWLTAVLGGLLLVVSAVAVAAQRRYLALQRKHKALQRLYDKAEQQLSTLWATRKP